jgi:hypothetical protein
VDQVGEIGTEATKPGGAVSELTSGVGDTLGNLGDSLRGVTEKVNPKRLVSGSGPGSTVTRGARDGKAAKAAARVAAGGAAGLLVSALYRASRRPRVLGVPIGRKGGLGRAVEQIGRAGTK